MEGDAPEPMNSSPKRAALYLLMLLPAAWPLAVLAGMVLERVRPRSAGTAYVVALIWAFFSPLLFLIVFTALYRARRSLSRTVKRAYVALLGLSFAVSLYGCTMSFESCADHERPVFIPPARGRQHSTAPKK